MVFVPTEENKKNLYTMAPGRKMPMHPNPKEHIGIDGEVNEQSFRQSSQAWVNTVMLIGKGVVGENVSN